MKKVNIQTKITGRQINFKKYFKNKFGLYIYCIYICYTKPFIMNSTISKKLEAVKEMKAKTFFTEIAFDVVSKIDTSDVIESFETYEEAENSIKAIGAERTLTINPVLICSATGEVITENSTLMKLYAKEATA